MAIIIPQRNILLWKLFGDAVKQDLTLGSISNAAARLLDDWFCSGSLTPDELEEVKIILAQLYVFAEAIYRLRVPGPKKAILPIPYHYAFTKEAYGNTIKGIETMGILFGKTLEENQCHIVTTILIPEQIGTTDQCGMVDESVLVQFSSENDVQVLGWIHTHPTQGCFLSSVDMHTQAVWQKMIPETIAIVCATNLDCAQVFRLTDLGLDTILKCNRGSHTFHGSHLKFLGDEFLYTTLDRNFVEDADLPLRIVNLRNKENPIDVFYSQGWHRGDEKETQNEEDNDEVNLTPSGAPPDVAAKVGKDSGVHEKEKENPELAETFSDNVSLMNLPPPTPSQIAVDHGGPSSGPIRTRRKRQRPWAV